MKHGTLRCGTLWTGLLTVAVGATLGALVSEDLLAADPAEVEVLLDEELSIRFRGGVSARRLGPDTIRIRTADGRHARGTTLRGRFVHDNAAQRRVVLRPEAIREYYQLELGMIRVDAEKKAERLLRSLERTGKLKKLDAIDRGLHNVFGPSWGAGARLDDAEVTAVYPPVLQEFDPLQSYRHGIAGDDSLWAAHVGGDVSAFPQLRANPEYERFFHPVDPDTGIAQAESVLRGREYRRVLIRRNRRSVLFLPDLPNRADLSDAGFEPGETYELRVQKPLRGAKRLATGLGIAAKLAGGRASLLTANEIPLFAGVDERVGVSKVAVRPRIVNVTPPNGERLVDATTDWENPDNMYLVPVVARRTFTVRLRFAQPLDPRTVDETTFLITKVATEVGTAQEADVNVPVEVGVFISQSRLGEVRVDVTPALNLDPRCRYQVRVDGAVRSLSGERLPRDYVSMFETF
jgi:hypothetical protein